MLFLRKTHFKNSTAGAYFPDYVKCSSSSGAKNTVHGIIMVILITTHVITKIECGGHFAMVIQLAPLKSLTYTVFFHWYFSIFFSILIFKSKSIKQFNVLNTLWKFDNCTFQWLKDNNFISIWNPIWKWETNVFHFIYWKVITY